MSTRDSESFLSAKWSWGNWESHIRAPGTSSTSSRGSASEPYSVVNPNDPKLYTIREPALQFKFETCSVFPSSSYAADADDSLAVIESLIRTSTDHRSLIDYWPGKLEKVLAYLLACAVPNGRQLYPSCRDGQWGH